MKGVPALYKGKLVSKENFRTNVYSMNGTKKIVESWDEYEQHMESGIWFASKKDAMSRIPADKPRVRNSRVKREAIQKEEVNEIDDFLPVASE